MATNDDTAIPPSSDHTLTCLGTREVTLRTANNSIPAVIAVFGPKQEEGSEGHNNSEQPPLMLMLTDGSTSYAVR